MYSKIANGNIKPYRFVKLDTTTIGRILQATAGSQIWGVSQLGTRWPPWGPLDDGYAAVAGESLNVFGPGDLTGFNILVKAGQNATIGIGNKLKSDSDGCAIPTTTAGDEYGAIALRSGTGGASATGGQLILVQLVFPSQTYTGV